MINIPYGSHCSFPRFPSVKSSTFETDLRILLWSKTEAHRLIVQTKTMAPKKSQKPKTKTLFKTMLTKATKEGEKGVKARSRNWTDDETKLFADVLADDENNFCATYSAFFFDTAQKNHFHHPPCASSCASYFAKLRGLP